MNNPQITYLQHQFQKFSSNSNSFLVTSSLLLKNVKNLGVEKQHLLLFDALHPKQSPFAFNNQDIGHVRSIKPEDERETNWCNSFWFTSDADLIFTKPSQCKKS